MTAQSKAWVYSRSPAEIVGSNPIWGMDVCVLSGRGLCDGLITRPEESYRLCCVVVCALEASIMASLLPALGRGATGGKNCGYSVSNITNGLYETVNEFRRSVEASR